MSYIKKYLLQFVLLLFIFCLSVQHSLGQVSVTAFANQNTILTDEFIKLEFIVENTYEVQKFIPPSFGGCKVVEGPTYSTGTSVVNGELKNNVSITYVVQPGEPGEYQLSGAAVQVNGRRFIFNAILFKVIEHNNNQYGFQNQFYDKGGMDQQLYQDYIIRKGENIHNKIRQNLFIKVDVSKNHCYEGEPVVATYKLYSRLHSDSKVSKRPSFNGFSVYDLVEPSTAPVTVEKFNGNVFNVYLIRKAQLFPLRPGTLELDPAEVENSVSFLRAESVRKNMEEYIPELLRSFESDNVLDENIVTEQVSVKSHPLPVTVKALPLTLRPASFDGAVGNFSIEASVDKNEIALNDAATVKVIIKGEGNFGVINAPVIQWPEDIEAYEPEIRENILKTTSPMRGYKTFAYTVMPKRTGVLVIPPVEFSYFDPLRDQYTTSKTAAVIIHTVSEVLKSESEPVAISTTQMNRKSGISKWLWISGAVVLLSFTGFFGFRYFSFSRRQPAFIGSQNKKTEKIIPDNQENIPLHLSSNPLFRARLMLIQHNGQRFYAELSNALWNFMNERLQDDNTVINKRNIAQHMKAKGFDDIIITQFQLLIQQCEMALYTPAAYETEMQSAYDLAEDLLEDISKFS